MAIRSASRGPAGFLRVLDDKTLAFADFSGNRQYITVGNAGVNDRTALFLMDYPSRRRLKIYAHAEIQDLGNNPDLTARLAMPDYKAKIERAAVLRLEGFNWNCPQHITPRFSEAELHGALEPVAQRLRELEVENKELRDKVAAAGPSLSH